VNGVKIGKIIASRAKYKGIKLRDVVNTLTDTGDWYWALVDKIEGEMERERDDEVFGRNFGGRVGKTEKEKRERKKLERVGRLMMVLVTAAEEEVEKVLKGRNVIC
jgi:hypothetical protein